MYGNAPIRTDGPGADLTPDQRRALRRDLTSVAARTRELLPDEFVVGSEITADANGARATVAVQPPVGSVVSADYAPDGEPAIDEAQRDDLAMGLAASAALQVKRAMPDDPSPTAR
ncbi:hypothetical protein BRD09_00705 [Halobacteriales archaeon SW_10_68_16]|jgi:hypothetical protein|nr:MAG: hypothetical protein BRD09_00705 [Halobacteriales archaeon SW_10_68_16]